MRFHLKKLALVLLGLLSIGLTQVSANDSCLMLDTSPTTGILDVHSGAYTEIPNLPIDAISQDPSFVGDIDGLSPDRFRFASLASDGNSSVTLKVTEFEKPLPLGQRGSLAQRLGLSDEVFWSPDSQWIFYIWRDSVTSTWGIADKNGNKLHEQSVARYNELDSTGYEIQFDSWSPDSQFFSLIEAPNLDFFSVSDFKMIDSVPVNDCEIEGDDTEHYLSCAKWIGKGHQVAYISGNEQNPQLTITTVGSTHKTIHNLPSPVAMDTQEPYQIVPGQRYVAVSAFIPPRMEISAYDVSTGRHFKIDVSDISNIGNLTESNLFPDYTFTWSPDGKTLIFARYTDKDLHTVQVISYNVDTGNRRVLFTSTSNLVLDLFPSADSKTVVIVQNVVYLSSLDGKWESQMLGHPIVPSGPIAWSTDESLLAVANSGFDNMTNDVSSAYVDIYHSDGVEIIHKEIPSKSPIRDMLWTTCPKT